MQLNPEQQLVANHVYGPMRVAAVAGSGKTSALVERCATLIEKNKTPPSQILVISFSVGARETMDKRLKKRLARFNTKDISRTFHSLALEVVRTERGRPVLDTSGKMYSAVLRTAVKRIGLQPQAVAQATRAVKRYAGIVKTKDLGASIEDIEMLHRLGVELSPKILPERSEGTLRIEEIVQAFFHAEMLRNSGEVTGRPFLTFDDLVFDAVLLLEDHKRRERWSDRWLFVMQDECQDDNEIQAKLADLLVRRHGNYVVVGDPAQAVYSFRGSSPKHILDFDKHYANAITVAMNRNYRSGREIAAVANALVWSMPPETVLTTTAGRILMKSERDTKAYVGFHGFFNADAEGAAIATNCEAHRRDGVDYRDMAILVRLRRQTRAIELALAAKGIPAHVPTDTSFFTQTEVQIAISYLRIAAGLGTADDAENALRILKPSKENMQAFERKLATMDLLGAVDAIFGHEARSTISMLRQLMSIAEHHAPAKVVDAIVREMSGWLKKMGEEEDSSPLDNVEELRRFAAKFDRLDKMVESLDNVLRARKRGGTDAVSVTTIHRAKGLEYPVVFVPGLVAGILPCRAASDPDEERRILYVACTRAMNELWLSRFEFEEEMHRDDEGIEQWRDAPTSPSPYLIELLDRAIGIDADVFVPKAHIATTSKPQLALF